MRLAAPGLLCALVLVVGGTAASAQTATAAVDAFWRAASLEAAEQAAAAVVRSGIGFEDALARLKRGRTYSPDVPRGVVKAIRTAGGQQFPYSLDVPANYDPQRRYQVRVQLHGGITRPEATVRGDGGIGALAGAEQIYVLPTAWRDAPWWGDLQLANLRAILDSVKRTYNVDENRVVLSGVSDGGTAAYYVAMRDTTPYAAFLPLNGFLMILAQPSVGITELLFPNNLRNKPWFIVNGGKDPLYPTSLVDPYVTHLQNGGASVTYRPQPDAVHNTAWWPDVKDAFEDFVRTHPRQPHPAAVTWQTDDPARWNRAHWVIVDRLAPLGADEPLPDLNDRVRGEMMNFGVRTSGMRISSVMAGSNAAAIGLRPGDLVASINGRVIPEGVNLLDLLSIIEPGQPLRLVVTRDGAQVELNGEFRPVMMPNVSQLFPRVRPWGRVDVRREGNTVTATTRGVAGFTLLLSPDVFDFDRAITVIADGRTVFNGAVRRDVATLMKWAARDNDRTMLYGAELPVTLDR